MGKWFVYLLRCRDGSLYCGITNNLEKRVKAHNAGTASKYTRPRRPVILVYWEKRSSKVEAMKREYQIKRLPKVEKEALCYDYHYKAT